MTSYLLNEALLAKITIIIISRDERDVPLMKYITNT